MKLFTGTVAVVLTAITLTACSGSPTSPSALSGSFARIGIQADSNESDSPGWSAADLRFATDLANTEFALLAFGTRAETLSDGQDVALFASELRRHYESAFAELTQVGGNRLPRITTLNSDDQNFNTRLTSVTGSEFDRMFMQYVVETLRSNLALLTTQGLMASSDLARLAASEAQSEAELLRRGLEIARAVGVTGLGD
jgi:predicted outer membrane protein